jgi:hypothetical protein
MAGGKLRHPFTNLNNNARFKSSFKITFFKQGVMIMMLLPKKNSYVFEISDREEAYKSQIEFKRQVENFRQAGFQEGILSVLKKSEQSITSNSRIHATFENSDKIISFMLVVPRTYKTVYDQISSFGFLPKNFDLLEISDTDICPAKPYCLYNINVEEAEKNKMLDDLEKKIKITDSLGLTDVEIISLALHFPELRKNIICSAGSKYLKKFFPCLENNKGKSMLRVFSQTFSGYPGMDTDKIIMPSCLSRSYNY